MNRHIKTAGRKYADEAANLIEDVFAASEGAESGLLAKNLALEIRGSRFYVPELELITVNENSVILGYAMFSKFSLQGKYEDELLLLSPVAVKTEFQRRHISKELIEFGFQRASKMGFKAVIVEGDPQNYSARGFKTSSDFGITADESLKLPSPECLMAKELVPGALKNIHGVVEFSAYKTLS